jgi:hypothetical protein
MTPPVDPWSPSSNPETMASVSPGNLKEWHWSDTTTRNFSGAAGSVIPLWSGTGGANDGFEGAYGAVVAKNQILYLWGIEAGNANTSVAGNDRCIGITLSTSAGGTTENVWHFTSKATGPYMLEYDIPLGIRGDSNTDSDEGVVVYATIAHNLNATGGAGSATANRNNWTQIRYTIVDNP